MLNNVGVVRPGARRAIARLLACSILSVPAIGGIPTARAQVAAAAPVRQSIDANGVDLLLGTMNAAGPALSAGQSGAQGMAYQMLMRGSAGWGDNLVATLSVSGSTVHVAFAGKTDRFTISGSSYIPTEGNGSTLSLSGNVYTYTLGDGTVIHLNKVYAGSGSFQTVSGVVTDVTRPSGEALTYTFDSMYYCSQSKDSSEGQICTGHSYAYRVSTVQSNSGYKLTFNNAAANTNPDDIFGTDWENWTKTNGVSLTNTKVAGASSRSQGFSWSISNGNTYLTLTDPLERATVFRAVTGRLHGIKRPGSSGEDVTVTYDGSGRVFTVTNAVGTTTYTYSDAGGLRTTTVTNPFGHPTVYVFDIASQRMKSAKDPLLRTTQWDYDSAGRVTRVTAPEGNYTQYTYDARGNVTETRAVGKTGPGPGDIVTTANFDASCTYAAKCNQPNWTQDPKSNRTDYSYNTSTGDLVSVARPAATSGGVRPTTTYSYTTVNGVQQVSDVSTCQTTASCVGTADEVKTSIGYDVNGLPNVISKGAGNGSLTATTSTVYDDVGNVMTVDGPLAGSSDTTRYRYDAARQLVGMTTPDPDGGSALKPRAQRITYDAKGRVTLAETGNVNSQSDGDWTGFASLQQVSTDYDAADRKVKQTVSAGGTTHHVVQYSYDPAGLYDCTAVRMNSATWGSLPDACTLTTPGAAGPDRITRNIYDGARQLTKVQTAYGTADQSDEVTRGYTNNGRLASVTDAEGNKTSYEYDVFDRPSITRYPITTVAAGTSSTSDYEQLGYDAASNVTSRRLRDGQTITYGYDGLNRVSSKSLPSPELSVNYSYDLLSRPVTVSRPGDGVTHTLTYNALSQLTNEAQPFGSISYQYDVAGRRTRMTWWDGVYVDYDYLVTGEMAAVRENGATSGVGVLATMAYDDLGRRKNIIRGNGTVADFGYNPASQLASLDTNLAGTAWDTRFEFAYNSAGQISGTTRMNDGYAWTSHYNVDRSYATNGLNQVTTAGGTGLGYDARGNLNVSGNTVYGYTVENMLKSASTGLSLYYDALGRLVEYNTTASTRFVYDGSHMTAEVANPSGAILRRYVFGPGADEPLVWYEGAGLSDKRWLHADERGSVVAVSDGSGNAIGINRYDEYGIPAATNIGRFQYTGQAWLPELGMYYYKARIYSPSLGRFMQTDPIGYGDGMNLYNYVGNDPVNYVDPDGKKKVYCTGSIIPQDSCSGGASSLLTIGGTWECLDCKQEGRDDNGTIVLNAPTWIFRSFSDYVFANVTSSFVSNVSDVSELILEGICMLPPINVGGGVDGYFGLGGSLGGQVSIDIAGGSVGASVNGGVGVGFGLDAGANIGTTLTTSGPRFGRDLGRGGAISANLTTTVGGGFGLTGSVQSSLVGTNAGQVEASVGRGGASAFANGGASVGGNFQFDSGCQ